MSAAFSIILPVRNGGDHVKECVNSILGQTYTSFNLIVLDNCSTDGTLEWIRSLNNERIIIYPSERSLTIEENWARIVSVPKNEFMTCIGHDDLLAADYLAIMHALIEKYPDASLYQTHFTYIDTKGAEIKKCKPMSGKYSGAEFLSAILSCSIDIMGTGFMTRSKDHDAVGGIPPYPSLLFADFELWFRLAAISYIVVAKKSCFSFRLHQSTTGAASDSRMQLAFERFIDFLDEIQHKDKAYTAVININISYFLLFNCKSLSHRLLRTPYANRAGLSVQQFVNKTKAYYQRFGSVIPYEPEKKLSVKLAITIDNNRIFRKCFLLFKKFYRKPIIRSG